MTTELTSSRAGEARTVETVCNMCTNHCGITARVKNGKIVQIDKSRTHPLHQLCLKPYAIPEVVHSPQRLTSPLKKVKGEFAPISWDEAFGFIAGELARIKKMHGASAVVPFAGNGLACRSQTRVVRRFADVYGTPNFITGGWTCFSARVMAFTLTLGCFPNPDFSAANRCMLIWGKNPTESLASEKNDIGQALKRGSKLIVIDPRATALAKKADIHAQIRPGTDGALALGILNVLIAEERYDKKFVKNWTIGFEKLVDRVREYPPEKVEGITWVPAEKIRDIARMYASQHPACISTGISLDHSSNGIQTQRAIAVIMAVCGNLEIQGGNVSYPGMRYQNFTVPERVAGDTPVGADFPLFAQLRGHQSGTRVIDAILTEDPYPIKAMLIDGGNPAVNWPDSRRVRQALEKLELLVVIDMFMTDTAKLADIVLPAAGDLETEDLRDGYFNHECLPLIVKSNKVIEPIGQSMEDWRIWTELGRRMGYEAYFPWKDSDDLIREMIKPSQITLDQLKANPGGVLYSEKAIKSFRENGFNTPSKKVEIYSETMDKLGYDPLPAFHEPLESPVSRPDLVREYPFVLTTGPRVEAYTHSRYRNVSRLQKHCPEPVAEINTLTARKLGIAEEDRVTVSSPRGSICLKAKVTDDIHPRVVSILNGWSSDSGANANYLTNSEARDPVSGFPEFKALVCNVVKA